MNKFLQRPYILFWILIPFLILLGLYNREYTLDINIHDTYYIFMQKDVSYIFAFILGLIGIVYWILLRSKFRALSTLSLIHLVFTIIGMYILLDISGFFNIDTFTKKTYYTNISAPNTNILYGLAILIIGQLIFILNISIGFFKGETKTL